LVFKGLRAKLLKAKAKAHGMTVPELEKYLAERKVEKRKFKEELRRKEREEKQKHEKWKIEQKYKQKRKQVKTGKSGGVLGLIELLGGSQSKGVNADPLGIFSSPTRKKKRKRRKKR
jgi:hypothetical protein